MADSLAGTVKVPVIGNVPKKEAAIGLVVVATLIGVYYYRQRQSSSSATGTSSAAAAGTSSDQYPPDGTVGNPQDPYSTDPATNQTYGDEAAGSGGTFGAFGTGSGLSSSSFPWDGTYGNSSDPYSLDTSTGQTYGNEGLAGNIPSSSGSSGPPFTSNEAWSNWVLQQEQTNNPGSNVGAWTDALGLYLNGQPVDTSQRQIIFDAIAIGGDPPIAGTNGYPPNVRLNGSKGGQTTVTVPAVTGDRADTARQKLRAAGLAYNISDKATGSVTAQSPKAGANAHQGSTVRLTLKADAVKAGPTPKPPAKK